MVPKRSRIVWRGSSWQLRLDEWQSPDGQSYEKGVVEHPGSVVLLPLDGENVIMLQQYRHSLGQTILELPAGTRHWDEDWLSCAQRELREETGYRAENFTSLGQVWAAPGLSNEQMYLFLASNLSPAPLPADADEMITLQPTPLAELVKMALDGRLTDAKSVVTILRAAVYLKTTANLDNSST